MYIKDHRFNYYKTSKNHNSTDYLKSWKYNAYIHRKIICHYITKKYYIIYIAQKEKYKDYEELPSKYISNSKFIHYKLKLKII